MLVEIKNIGYDKHLLFKCLSRFSAKNVWEIPLLKGAFYVTISTYSGTSQNKKLQISMDMKNFSLANFMVK